MDNSVDLMVEESMHIIDNDFEDEDTTSGLYQVTMAGDEGLATISNLHFLALAEDAGGSATAAGVIEPTSTGFSVSGTVTPATANVIIGAFPSGAMEGPEGLPWMTVTDVSGNYRIYLSVVDTVEIFAFDFLGVLGGLLPDTAYHEVYVTGAQTGYNFNFIAPTSFVEGSVLDQDNFPVPGILVMAGGEGPGGWDTTDASAHYSI
ncbi:MAG: hypothetical protein IH972_01440, partial [Candidatus Marinimicrobia bacterium]|nr:hypothetical protein [Candidatus Neomarinimicrobiota bacterium]